jgi:hypothetical protein
LLGLKNLSVRELKNRCLLNIQSQKLCKSRKRDSVGWVSCGGTSPPGLSPKFGIWYERLYLFEFISGLPDAILSVVDDIPVNNETPVVTSVDSVLQRCS